MTQSTRTYDLTVFGATGFVGVLVADYLAKTAPVGMKIALAGRSQSKLDRVLAGLPQAQATFSSVVVDAADEAAVTQMAKVTTAVVTTVGPYAKYGMPLVAACAATGTHYADLTGEVLFVHETAQRYHQQAMSTGAKIVHSCGFDSIPSDLSVFESFRAVHEREADTLTDTTLVVQAMKGGFSGGTIDSMRTQLDITTQDRKAAKTVIDPFALAVDRSAEPPPARDSRDNDFFGVIQDAVTGTWLGPFVMASYNTRIVRRSNSLMNHAYGPEFHYQEYLNFGKKPWSPVLASGMMLGLGGLMAGLKFPPSRYVLDRLLPAPGQGPSEESRQAGFFRMKTRSMSTGGRRVETLFAAQGDPGYAATAVMLGESGLALALDGEALPARAGVLTPAVALGGVLVERLRRQGFTIDTHVTDTTN